MSYVYLYLDPRKHVELEIEEVQINFLPMYVGKGTGERYAAHLIEAANPILRRKIKRIEAENLSPIVIKIKDALIDSDAFALEKKLVARFGRLDLGTGVLCNMTDGGDGVSSRDATANNNARYADGYTMSEKGRDTVRASRIKTNQSVEFRKINSERNSGTYEERYGLETAAKMKEDRRKQMTGANNPASKTYKIIKDTGEIEIITGLKSYCREHGLIWNTVKANVGKGKIVKTSVKDTSFVQSETKRKIAGWEIIELTKTGEAK